MAHQGRLAPKSGRPFHLNFLEPRQRHVVQPSCASFEHHAPRGWKIHGHGLGEGTRGSRHRRSATPGTRTAPKTDQLSTGVKTRSYLQRTMRLVETVDRLGRIGPPVEIAEAHSTGTPHRAISVIAWNFSRTKMLITRRAETKATWPGYWSNSVCSHPLPREPYVAAARGRLFEELRVHGSVLPLSDCITAQCAAPSPGCLSMSSTMFFMQGCPKPSPYARIELRYRPFGGSTKLSCRRCCSPANLRHGSR
jgi:isopentenyl-diphosphate delta-isomerase type 1